MCGHFSNNYPNFSLLAAPFNSSIINKSLHGCKAVIAKYADVIDILVLTSICIMKRKIQIQLKVETWRQYL